MEKTTKSSNKTKVCRPAALVVLLVLFVNNLPAAATRLPEELRTSISSRFAKVQIRLDGSFETPAGDLFLPLIPPGSPGKGPVHLQYAYPTQGAPELLLYDNGWCYLKVIKKACSRL